jgi:hypothetical protein
LVGTPHRTGKEGDGVVQTAVIAGEWRGEGRRDQAARKKKRPEDGLRTIGKRHNVT